MTKIIDADLSKEQLNLIENIFEYIEKIYELMKNYDEKQKNEKVISI
jgi:hypothetical protein